MTKYARLVFLFARNASGTSQAPSALQTGIQTLSSPRRGTFRASIFFMGESYITSDAIAHELGHSFGNSNALSVRCIPTSLTDPTDSCGSTSEDAGDTMGSSSGYQHFSSAIKFLNFWLGSSQVQTLSDSGEYILDQIELASSGMKALRIPLGKDPNGATTSYWVEYRTPGTFDTDQGLQIRYQSSSFFNGSSMGDNTLRFSGAALPGTGNGSISGKILRQSDGTPVANVGIYLLDLRGSYLKSAYTDSSGIYTFTGLNAGDYYVRTGYNNEGLVTLYYKNSISQNSAAPVTVATDKVVSNIDIALPPGSTITGTITNETDGQPIQGVYVNPYDNSGSSVPATTSSTDSLGRYFIRGLPAGDYFLQASYSGSAAYGYMSRYYINGKDRTTATPVSVGIEDKITDIDFSLAAGGAISGRIIAQATGNPLQGVSVYAYDSSSSSYGGGGTTDALGRYVIRNLAVGSYYVNTSNYTGYITKYYKDAAARNDATAVQVAASVETTGIDFALVSGGSISGRVVNQANGNPIQSVYVYASESSGSSSSGSTTDSSGRYLIRGLSTGSYYVNTSSSQGYVNKYYKDASSRSTATVVQVTVATETSGIDFELVVGGSISGRILSKSDNTPVPNSYAGAYDSSWNWITSGSADSSGRFVIRGLGTGSYYVYANGQGHSFRYYNDVGIQSAATAVQVTVPSDTPGIDFLLPRSSGAPSEFPVPPPDLSSAGGSGPPGQEGTDPAPAPPLQSPAPDVTLTAPFVDPYRGVKVELLESAGSGASANARVKVTLTKLRFDQGHLISFGQLPVNGTAAKELTITNQNSEPVTFGIANIKGRNARNFSISRDLCSGMALESNASCKIEVTFSAESYSGNTSGEFAVLSIPNSDIVAGQASIDLWGAVLASDLYVYQSSSDLAVGQNSTVSIQLINRGTVRFSSVAKVTEKLPPGSQFLWASSGWNCTSTGSDVSCSKTLTLSPNYSEVLQITFLVGAEAAPYCTMRATVLSELDPNPANNVYILSASVSGGFASSYGANLLKGGGTSTGIALYNGGTATAALSMTALNRFGSPLQAAGIQNPATAVLKPGEQLVLMDSELWGFPDSVKSDINWFSLSSSTQKIFGFEMAFDGELKTMDGATLSRSPMSAAVFPDVVTNDFTTIHIINPNSGYVDLWLSLISADGGVRATAVRNLTPSGSLLETVSNLFPGINAAESDYIRVSGSGTFIGTETMGAADRWIKVLAAQGANSGANVLYASQYVTGGDYWRSTISVVNLDAAAAQVSARLIDDTGKPIGPTLLYPIKGYGKILLTAQDLFGQTGTSSGYVEIRSDSTKLAGSVTFGNQGGTVCAALPLQTAEYRELVFGQVASDSTWYTGVAVVNPNASDVSATLQLLDKFGKVVDSTTQVIKAGERKIGLVEQFFPKAAETGVSSGYIRVSSNGPLAGLALFGTGNGEVLSAIPSYNIR